MKGRIDVQVNSSLGLIYPPSDYEFGLSFFRNTPPYIAQSSPVFSDLEAGVYFVFYRKKGENWDINKVLQKEVILTETVLADVNPTTNFVLFRTKKGAEIREVIEEITFRVQQTGQTKFTLPVQNSFRREQLISVQVNAEVYTDTNFSFSEKNREFTWKGLFELEVDDLIIAKFLTFKLIE